MNYCIKIKLCDVIIHPWPKFNCGLAKPPFMLEHEWVITSDNKLWNVIIYAFLDLSRLSFSRRIMSAT